VIQGTTKLGMGSNADTVLFRMHRSYTEKAETRRRNGCATEEHEENVEDGKVGHDAVFLFVFGLMKGLVLIVSRWMICKTTDSSQRGNKFLSLGLVKGLDRESSTLDRVLSVVIVHDTGGACLQGHFGRIDFRLFVSFMHKTINTAGGAKNDNDGSATSILQTIVRSTSLT
jgi:hypothetical protein